MISSLPMHVCRLCVDIRSPLEDGIYVIAGHQGIIVKEGKELVNRKYSKGYSLGQILDDIMDTEVLIE